MKDVQLIVVRTLDDRSIKRVEEVIELRNEGLINTKYKRLDSYTWFMDCSILHAHALNEERKKISKLLRDAGARVEILA